MAFKFPWFRKKDKPANDAAKAEAPAKQANETKAAQPAAPVELPKMTPADLICDALDQMAQTLIATDSSDPRQAIKLIAAMSLQDLSFSVTGDACAFAQLDDEIIRTIRRFDTLCTTCTEEQLNRHIARLKDAIGVRHLNKDNCRAFVPTMETHFYELRLLCLQGDRNARLAHIAELEHELEQTTSAPDYNADASLWYVSSLRDSIAKEKDSLRGTEHEIDKARGLYIASKTALKQIDELPPINAAEAQKRIDALVRESSESLLRTERENIDFLNRRNAWLKEHREVKFKLKRARAEKRRLMAEAEALMNYDDDLLEQPIVPVPEAPAEEAVEEAPVELPVMPDVFEEEFKPQAM